MIFQSAESKIGQPIESPASGSLPPVCPEPHKPIQFPGEVSGSFDAHIDDLTGRGAKIDQRRFACARSLNSIFSNFTGYEGTPLFPFLASSV
jgi:hypothetical protein